MQEQIIEISMRVKLPINVNPVTVLHSAVQGAHVGLESGLYGVPAELIEVTGKIRTVVIRTSSGVSSSREGKDRGTQEQAELKKT